MHRRFTRHRPGSERPDHRAGSRTGRHGVRDVRAAVVFARRVLSDDLARVRTDDAAEEGTDRAPEPRFRITHGLTRSLPRRIA